MSSELLAKGEIQRALDEVSDAIARVLTSSGSPTTAPQLPMDLSQAAVVGIRRGGAHLAQRLAKKLRTQTGFDIPLGLLDITLYRDDVLVGQDNPFPILHGTDIPFSLAGRPVILVDDVLFTGRTVRAALGALLDVGRPGRVWLCVLVDRGLRELPIQADFVGATCTAAADERVVVELIEEGHDTDRVVVIPAGTP